MASTPIRVGLVGAHARFGWARHSHIPALQALPDFTLAAVATRNSVAVGPIPHGFGIEVELRICLPGLPRTEADSLVEKAQALCPYSNATRDNVHVRLVIA